MKRIPLLHYGADTDSAALRFEAAVLRRLPPRWRRTVRRLLYLPSDLVDRARGRRQAMVPPRGLTSVGAGDFKATGEQYLTYLQTHCGLTPSSRMLDLGCGIGRMGVPMAAFLDGGTYDGLDVSAPDIRWCRRHLSRRHPHLRFHHVDVFHREYNPAGKLRAVDVLLPFADRSFDVVLASSLFTHLLAPEAAHYLREIARVLAVGGTAFLTFFLLNDEARAQIDAGACGLKFQHARGDAFLHDPANPEAAVAYDESFVLELCRQSGLEVPGEPLYGCWCCRPEFTSYQDILLAVPAES